MDVDAARELLLAHLGLIDRIVAAVRWRHRLGVAEADDFAASVRLRLVENDYEVIRRFRGDSRLQTYLTVVIARLYADHRIGALGKWRPSAAAIRHGMVAMLFERLTVRDGLTFDEACETMRTTYRIEVPLEQLHSIVADLPPRAVRRMVGDDVLESVEDPGSRADVAIRRQEWAAQSARARAALASEMESLPPRDRLVIRLHFEEGLHLSDVARLMGEDQKRLYREVDRLLQRLRTRLEASGVKGHEVADWIGAAWLPETTDHSGPLGKAGARPSV